MKHVDPKYAVTEISNSLLRLAKLYQIPNFDEANALILAEWTMDNFKHKTIGLILDALKNPPVLYEDGQISKNWRLTPDTIFAWIDKKAKDIEELRQVEQTRKAHAELAHGGDLSPKGQQMIKKYLDKLQAEMFKGKPLEMSPELRRIDLMISLLAQYKKESIDPITGKLYLEAIDEREWLLNKGYFIDGNGEIQPI